MHFIQSRVFHPPDAEEVEFEWEGRPRIFLVRATGETPYDQYALLMEKGTEVSLPNGRTLANLLVFYYDRNGDEADITEIDDEEEREAAYRAFIREIDNLESDDEAPPTVEADA